MAPRRPRQASVPKPEEVIVATVEVADEDVQRFADAMTAPPVDHSRTWPHEVTFDYRVPYAARGKIATQLLEAASVLGYPPASIRSQTDGFLVPAAVYYHLFPSQDPDAE